MLVVGYLLARGGAFARVLARSILNDLGNLLLAFVMVYAYVSFSQFLIIWSANLPEEIPWYLHRIAGGWNLVAIALAVFYFVVPFLVLLGRRQQAADRGAWRRSRGACSRPGCSSVFFLIGPALYRSASSSHWMDVAALGGLGGDLDLAVRLEARRRARVLALRRPRAGVGAGAAALTQHRGCRPWTGSSGTDMDRTVTPTTSTSRRRG